MTAMFILSLFACALMPFVVHEIGHYITYLFLNKKYDEKAKNILDFFTRKNLRFVFSTPDYFSKEDKIYLLSAGFIVEFFFTCVLCALTFSFSFVFTFLYYIVSIFHFSRYLIYGHETNDDIVSIVKERVG